VPCCASGSFSIISDILNWKVKDSFVVAWQIIIWTPPSRNRGLQSPSPKPVDWVDGNKRGKDIDNSGDDRRHEWSFLAKTQSQKKNRRIKHDHVNSRDLLEEWNEWTHATKLSPAAIFDQEMIFQSAFTQSDESFNPAS
jgi:hypothetical protein